MVLTRRTPELLSLLALWTLAIHDQPLGIAAQAGALRHVISGHVTNVTTGAALSVCTVADRARADIVVRLRE